MTNENHGTVELTTAQKELWLAGNLLPKSHPGLSCGGPFLTRGSIDLMVARQALTALVAHFPLLSSTLEMGADGLPFFRYNAHTEPEFEVFDVSLSSHPDQQAQSVCQNFYERPFTPIGGHLARYAYVQFSPTDGFLVIQNYHLVSGGVGTIAQYTLFSHFYACLKDGADLTCTPAPDWESFVAADKTYNASERCQRDRDYWMQTLAQAPNERVIPPLPEHPDILGDTATVWVSLSPEFMECIDRAVPASGRPELLTLLHILTLSLLYDTNVTTTFLIENGERKDPFRMHGYSVANLPLITRVTDDMTFEAARCHVEQVLRGLRRHTRANVHGILRETRQQHALMPLWDTALNFFPYVCSSNAYFENLDFGPSVCCQDPVLLNTFVLLGLHPGDPLRLRVVYSRNHFTEKSAVDYIHRMHQVLKTALDTPEKPLSDYSVILPEQVRALAAWENGATVPIPPLTVAQLFCAAAQRSPAATAVLDEEGSFFSYADVARQAVTLGRRLTRHGVRPGDAVAVLGRRHRLLPGTILGVLCAGAVYLPIDPEYPKQRIQYMLEDSGVQHIVALEPDDAAVLERDCLPVQVPTDTTEDAPAALEQMLSRLGADPAQTAYMIYTSGSTGQPKGVRVAHSAFVNMILEQIRTFGITAGDRILHFASPSFDASLSDIFMALMAGACSCPISRALIDSPWDLKRYLNDKQVTVAVLPPSYLSRFFGEDTLPSLRVLVTAGEAPNAQTVRHYAGRLTYFNAYGPTEAAVCAGMQHLLTDSNPNTVGRPIANTGALILSANGRRLAPGLAGELWLFGASLASGYHNRPELTAERFARPQAAPGLRCYRTGDKAYWSADGRLILIGRTDNQVKINGQRLELSEVAATISQHPAVAQAVVVACQSDDRKILHTFVTAVADTPVPPTRVFRQWLSERLPAYMIPSDFHLCESFPLTPAGKVDQRALTERCLQATTRHSTLPDRKVSVREAAVAEIFSRVLQRPVNDVNADFFSLGGDSLLAVRLLRELEALDVRLTLRDLYSAPSVRAATALADAVTVRQPPCADAGDEPLALTAPQIALWAQETVHGGTDRYHLPILFELDGPEQNISRLLDALDQALSAQPLCTATIEGPVEAPYFVPGARRVPACERISCPDQYALSRAVGDFLARPFHLRDDVLVRTALLTTPAGQHILAIVLHHLIGDATGLLAIINDTARLYEGQPISAEQRLEHLRQHVSKQRQSAAPTQAELDIWRSTLIPLPASPLTALGLTAADPTSVHPTHMLSVTVSGGSAEELRQLAQRHHTTPFVTLAAVLGNTLCEAAGSSDCLVSFPIGSRDDVSLSDLCAYFVRLGVMRLKAGTVSEAIQTAQSALSQSVFSTHLTAHVAARQLQLTPADRAALTDIIFTQADLPTLPLSENAGVCAVPLIPVLRSAKNPLTFLWQNDGQTLHLLATFDTARLNQAKVADLLAAWSVSLCQALGLNPAQACTEPSPFTLLDCPVHAPLPNAGTPAAPAEAVPQSSASTLLTARSALQSVWTELLGSWTGPTASFFAAGGDSIRAIEMTGRLRDAGFLLSPTDFFALSDFDALVQRMTPVPSAGSSDDGRRLALRQAWEALFGQSPAADSDFFAAGGDSVSAILLVGRLRDLGFALTPADCFSHPSFSRLATQLRSVSTPNDPLCRTRRAEPGSAVPIPEIIAYWKERHPHSWERFFMALAFSISPAVCEKTLRCAFFELARRHEALQMRVSGDCLIAETPRDPVWLELQAQPQLTLTEQFQSAAHTLLEHLSITDGERARYGIALFGVGTARYALLAAHHFSVDIASLYTIAEQITHYLHHGCFDSTPATGFVTFAREHAAAGHGDLSEEIAFWSAQQSARTQAEPPVFGPCLPAGQRITVSESPISFQFGRARRTGSLPELLCALSLALADVRVPELQLLLEGQALRTADTLSTVGWFTSLLPFTVRAAGRIRPLQLLESTGQTLRRFRQHEALYTAAVLKDSALTPSTDLSINFLSAALTGRQSRRPQDLTLLPELSVAALARELPADFVSDSAVDLTVLETDGQITLEAAVSAQATPFLRSLLSAWKNAVQTLQSAVLEAEAEHDALCATARCSVEQVLLFARPDAEQLSMLYDMELDRDAGVDRHCYVEQFTLTLAAGADTLPPDADALRQAWLQVAQRHEALRTLFPELSAGDYHRIVIKTPRIDFKQADLRTLPPDQQTARRSALLAAARSEPLVLATGPLLRIAFVQRATPEGDVLDMSVTFPHLLMDGWCIGISYSELFTLYEAIRAGRSTDGLLAPAPSLQAVMDALPPVNRQALHDFWSQRLAGMTPGCAVDFINRHFPAVAAQGTHGAEQSVCECLLGAEAADTLRTAAVAMKVTLAQCIELLWALFITSDSTAARRDTVFGTIYSGRPAHVARIGSVIGLFIRTLPVRVRWEEETTLSELAAAVSQEALATLPHERDMMADIQRSAGCSTLFDHLFVFENYPVQAVRSATQLTIRSYEGAESVPYPLCVAVVQAGQCYRFTGDGTVTADQIAALARSWIAFVTRAADRLRTQSAQNVLCRDIASGFTAAESPLPNDQRTDRTMSTIDAVFFHQVRATPQALACVGTAGDTFSYCELDVLAQRVCAGLWPVAPGEVIALDLSRGPGAVAAMLGIAMAGGVFMPIDTHSPAQRTARQLELVGCRRIITDKDDSLPLAAQGNGPAPVIVTLEHLISGTTVSDLFMCRHSRSGGDGLYIMFTSGTTGEPKAVLVPHRAVLRLVTDTSFWDITPQDRVLQGAPLAFDASTLEIWGSLLTGASLFFIDDSTLLDGVLFEQFLVSRKITTAWLTTGLFAFHSTLNPSVFHSLHCLLTGGDTVSPALARQVLHSCPSLLLINGYGPTENTTFTTTHRISLADTHRALPIGRAVNQTEVVIVDEHLVPVPDGVQGELCALGDGLALGYVNNPEATGRAFVMLPTLGRRAYRTGDRACRRPDGVIEFLGRLDRQIKIRGFRIELSSIEDKLRSVPGVSNAFVFIQTSGLSKIICAAVVAPGMTEDTIRKQISPQLPDYAIPHKLTVMKDFPVTANGKSDLRAVERLFQSRQLTPQVPSAASDTLTDITRKVAAVFADVLHLDSVPDDANFFRLGGQSLDTMVLRPRLNAAFGVSLTLKEIMSLHTAPAIAQCILTRTARTDHIHAAPPEPDSALTPQAAQRSAQHAAPLTLQQQQFWFEQRLHPESTMYSSCLPARLTGSLDPELLKDTWTLLQKRHEALRLCIVESAGDEPAQQLVMPVGSVPVQIENYADLDPAAAHTAAERRLAQEIEKPFVFGRNQPLCRVFYFFENPRTCLFLFISHHIVCDGWSLSVLFDELPAVYAALSQGRTPQLAPVTGFLSVVQRRRQHIDTPEGRRTLERARERLSPLPEPLELLFDRPRPEVRSTEGRSVDLTLDARLSAALRALASELDTTTYSVLTTLIAVVLYRHSGQSDMILGLPSACRDTADEMHVVGLLMNVSPLRLSLRPEQSFTRNILHCTQAVALAQDDAGCSLEALLSALHIERQPGKNPLFNILISPSDNRSHKAAEPDSPMQMTLLTRSSTQSRMDLTFMLYETEQTLQISIEYATALFDQETIEAMLARLRHLACAVSGLLPECPAGSDCPIARLPLLPDTEVAQLAQFNATAADWSNAGGMDRRFAQCVQSVPQAAALIAPDGTSLTYAAFDARVTRLSVWLCAQGIGSGTVTAVCFERGVTLMTALFALLRVGAAYVPIVPSLPPARVTQMLEDLPSASRILTTQSQAEQLIALGVDSARMLILDAPAPDCAAAELSLPAIPDQALAYILFTSGSTGRPKGVMVEQCGVLNRIQWMQSRYPIGAGDVLLQKTPVSFDVSVWELFWWSWYGASLALLAPDEERDPAAIVAAVRQHRVTVIHFVPSMLHVFLEYCEMHPDCVSQLASLKTVFASGEALTPAIVRLFNALLFASNGTRLENLYGPTEATVDVSWYPCSPFATDATRVPIGRPVANTTLHVIDSLGSTAPIGVAGELVIGGVQVARGYANRTDLTARSFVVAADGTRTYRTGDLARWRRDGVIEYLGRCDDQVKIRGFRIELGEVESVLETCPSVRQAVVRVGTLGNLPALEAFVLPVSGATLRRADLRRVLSERLPSYMHPARYFEVASIPLNASGKADRKRLPNDLPILKDSVPSAADPAQAAVVEAVPDTDSDLCARVRALWLETLPELKTVDTSVSFFDAGGSSLLLVRLLDRLNARWPGVFTLPDLFSCPSIQTQAAVIARSCQHPTDSKAAQPAACVAPIPAAASLPGHEPIAVIGLALRLADYDTPRDYWNDQLQGTDRLCELSLSRREDQTRLLSVLGFDTAQMRFKRAAYLDRIDVFDYSRFAMSPKDAARTDPEARLFIETALLALEDAGYGARALDGTAVGVYAGASTQALFSQALVRSDPAQSEAATVLNLPSGLVSRLSYLHNWSGSGAVIDTACSSVLVAVHEACAALRRGDCTAALVGGARLQLCLLNGLGARTIESSDGHTHAFAADADGTGCGEGCAVFLLKPLGAALADHDAIHAVIRGSAVNTDGRSAGILAPNPRAQSAVITAALADAGLTAPAISFIEAHGTGTRLGDPIEIDGLQGAFGSAFADASRPIITAKSLFGHLDSAAGGLGLMHAILTLEHGLVAPAPFFSRPNPQIPFAQAGLHVPTQPEPLHRHLGQRPACGVSAFGLTGINAHIVLEQAPTADTPADEQDPHFYAVVLSAGSSDALRTLAQRLFTHLSQQPAALTVAGVAGTLACGRDMLTHRAAFAVAALPELVSALRVWLDTHAATAAVTAQQDRTVSVCTASLAAAQQAAAGFLAGAQPLWPAGRPVLRAHLPTVPLESVRCWPAFGPAAAAVPAPADWPGSEVPVADGFDCAVPVTDPGFWPLTEHLLAGVPTLVGTGFVALTANAVRRRHRSGGFTLSDIRWKAPLQSPACAAAHLHFALLTDEWSVALRQDGTAETDGLFACARVTLRAAFTPALAVDRLTEDMLPMPGQALTGDQTVRASDRWLCRTAAWHSADQTAAVAHLELPPAYLSDLTALPWHPALLDNAMSFFIEPGLIPAACQSIALYRPLAASIWAYCVRTEHRPGERLSVDVTLTDDSGTVLVRLSGLTFVNPQLGQPRLHTLEWEPTASAGTAAQPAGTVVLAGQSPVMTALASELERRNIPVQQTGYPTGDELAAFTHRLADSTVAAVVALAPDGLSAWDYAAPIQAALQSVSAAASRRLLWLSLLPEAGAPASADHWLALGTLLAARAENSRLTAVGIELPPLMSGSAGLCAVQSLTAALCAPAALTSAGHVQLTEDGRFLQPVLSAPLTAAAPAQLPQGALVVTGGLGAMALTLARDLSYAPDAAQTGMRPVALLHRSPFPSPAQWPELAARTHCTGVPEQELVRKARMLVSMQSLGIRLQLIECDVTDEKSLSSALQTVRTTFGAIGTVLHTAGIAGAGLLLGKTRTTFESVCAPKLTGVRLLERLTQCDGKPYFLLASSRTALTGAPGQSDYTAANAALNAFACERTARGLPTLAIDWNTWADIGMAYRNGITSAYGLPPAMAGLVVRRAMAVHAPVVVVTMPGEPLTAEQSHPSQPATQTVAMPPATAVAAAQQDLSAQLLAVVARVLGYSTPVSPHDSFIDLGGDSLAAMDIVEAVQNDLHLRAELSDLMTAKTLGDFAARVQAGACDSRPESAVRASDDTSAAVPVTAIQLSVLHKELLMDGAIVNNLPQFHAVPETVTYDALREAVTALVARHSVLRTHFNGLDSDKTCMVTDPVRTPDFPRLRYGTAEEAAAALVTPFDLSNGPTSRFAWIDLTGQSSRHTGPASNTAAMLFMDIHHALADAHGVGLLFEDLDALLAHRPLPAVTYDMRSAALDASQHSDRHTQDLAYWTDCYAGGPVLTDIGDLPRPPIHSHRADTQVYTLSKPVCEALSRTARSAGVTLSSVLLALWAVLLGVSRKKMVIALACDTRTRQNEKTVGMFVSSLPLLFEADAQTALTDFLQSVHASSAQALSHCSCSLGELIGAQRWPLDPSRSTLAEVAFSFMNFGVQERTVYLAPRRNTASDLELFVSETGDGLTTAMIYCLDCLSPRHARWLATAYERLAELASLSPAASLASLLESVGQDRADTRVPADPSPRSAATGSAPSDPSDFEQVLSTCMSYFQKFFPQETITAESHFMELGGHSLLIIQLNNLLHTRYGRSVSMRDFFSNPTPRGLAQLMVSGRTAPAAAKPVLHSAPFGLYPLSHAQLRLYVLSKLAQTPEQARAYNTVFLFRCSRLLDTERLRTALIRLAHRQDVLRTVLIEKDGQPFQTVTDTALPRVQCHPQALPEEQAYALAAQQANAPFDPSCYMMRCIVCPLTGGGSCIALGLHHLIIDGWSLQILFDELLTLYDNPEAVLPALPLSYREFARTENSSSWSEAEHYWQESLKDLPPALIWPGTHYSLAERTVAAGEVTRTVQPATAEQLRSFCQAGSLSAAAVCLSLFGLLLSETTRRNDLIIGVGSLGRHCTQTEGLIGFFVNILPIRIRRPADGSLDTLLTGVAEQLDTALTYGSYPFDLLVRHCLPAGSLANGGQLVSVMFEYQRFNYASRDSRSIPGQRDFTVVDPTQWQPLVTNTPAAARYDFTLFVQDQPDGLRLRAQYRSDILSETTVKKYLQYLERLIDSSTRTKTSTHNEDRSPCN